GVYTGSSLSSLSSVGQSDDTTGSDKTSVVAFQATAGTTYQIAVDGYRGSSSGQAQGSIILNWSEKSPPSNGTFASAQLISGSAGSVGGSNVGAGLEAGDGPIAGNGGGARVWYRWTAPASGTASVDTHGSSFDTLLGVYTGSSLSSLSSVGQSDDTTSSDRTSAV